MDMNTESLFPFACELFLKSSAVLLLAAGITQCWRRATAAERHLVWCAALAVTLLLPATKMVTPKWTVPIDNAVRVTAALEMPQNVSALKAQPEMPTNPASAAGTTWKLPSWQTVGLTLWLGGTGCLLLYRGVGSWQLRRLYRQSTNVTDDRLTSALSLVREEWSLRQSIEIRLSPICRVPVTWGVWRPVILLPVEATNWSEHSLLAALRHETGHVHRADHLSRWIAFAASALYWPNPLIWLSSRSLRLSQEQATDDLVLSAGTPAEDYAGQLCEAARVLTSGGVLSRHAMAMASPSTLERRVLAIMDAERNRRPVGRFGWVMALAFGAMALGICAVAQLQSAETPKDGNLGGTVVASGGTLEVPKLIHITAKFIELTPEAVKSRPDLDTMKPVLNQEEYNTLIQTMSQTKGVDLMTSPSITASSKQLAVIEVIRDFTYPKAWERESDQAWKPTVFDTKKVGTTLEVLPKLRADGSLSLEVKPTVTEFLGFVDLETGKAATEKDHSAKSAQVLQAEESQKAATANRLKPIFSERKCSKGAALHSGETLVLTTFKQVGEVQPFEARLSQSKLIVLVTAMVFTPKIVTYEDVMKKAKSIIIPEIEFRDVPFADAIEILRTKAQENDPEGKGLGIMHQVEDAKNARITISLRDVPLSEAVSYVAQLGGLVSSVFGENLCIVPASSITVDDGSGKPKSPDATLPPADSSATTPKEQSQSPTTNINGGGSIDLKMHGGTLTFTQAGATPPSADNNGGPAKSSPSPTPTPVPAGAASNADTQQKAEITATNVTESPELVKAKGNVRFKLGLITVTSDEMEYKPTKHIGVFTGNVVLRKGNEKVTAKVASMAFGPDGRYFVVGEHKTEIVPEGAP